MPLQIVASDSQPGRTLTYTATGLPPGLAINSATGIISGTPTTAGSYTTTVTVTDNVGIQGKTTFSWSVSSIPSQGQKGPVGASVDTSIFGTTYTQRANTFDGYVGRPLAITTYRQYFSGVSSWPTTINSPHSIGEASKLGARVVISFKPAVDPTGSYTGATYQNDKTSLRNACQLFVANNVDFDICFYNEMNNAKNGFTGTNGIGVTGWLKFWQFYAPVVKNNGGNLSWVPAITHGFPDATPYFPNNPFPDKIHADWYSNDWYVHGITPLSYGLDALANPHNIPIGLGEFGPSNDPTVFTPTHAQWNSFIDDILIGYFGNTSPNTNFPNGGRLHQNLSNADIIYFGDATSLTSIGAVTGPSDYKVPGLQRVYDQLNA